jgi:hypothetical protein
VGLRTVVDLSELMVAGAVAEVIYSGQLKRLGKSPPLIDYPFKCTRVKA